MVGRDNRGTVDVAADSGKQKLKHKSEACVAGDEMRWRRGN